MSPPTALIGRVNRGAPRCVDRNGCAVGVRGVERFSPLRYNWQFPTNPHRPLDRTIRNTSKICLTP